MAGRAVPVVLTGDARAGDPTTPPRSTDARPPRPERGLSGQHPSRSWGHRRTPARLTIHVVEGRGIWVELDGCLTDGSLEQVALRLDRLAQLRFDVVVVGACGLRAIDHAGAALLGTFVQRVIEDRGSVVVVDPDERMRHVADALRGAVITRVPPNGAWWLS